MLLQFSVKNFLSFRDEVVLNMLPAKSRLLKAHVIEDRKGKKTECLPLAVVYGANASGKTNLVNAIDFVRNLVVSDTQASGTTGVTPFRLGVNCENAPSQFELVFKHDGVVYTYGFILNNSVVLEEWLFAYFTPRESKIFERKTEKDKVRVEAGSRLARTKDKRQFIRFVGQGTRPNQLFLTEANNRNVKLLEPIAHWFHDHLKIIRPQSLDQFLTLRVDKDESFVDFLSTFLRETDTGISAVRAEAEELDIGKHLKGMPPRLWEQIKGNLLAGKSDQLLVHRTEHGREESGAIVKGQEDASDDDQNLQYLRLRTSHKRDDGSDVDFELSAESDGTRRLMHLAPMLLDLHISEQVYVIDELDRSLHPLLSRKFVEAFLDQVQRKASRGQLILTTHDTTLLDRELLRRDEIWFTEKDSEGACHMTSLAEYKVSEGLNYASGYLNGRFGAIPFLGNFHGLPLKL